MTWREDPIRVRHWAASVLRICAAAGWSRTQSLDLVAQWADALRIPGPVLQTALQLLTLDEEADAVFRRLEQHN